MGNGMQIILCVSVIVCGTVYCLVRGWYILHPRRDGRWHDRTGTLRIVDAAGVTSYYNGNRQGIIDWNDVQSVEEL